MRQGKGGKDRIVPMGMRACSWVEKYLVEARPWLIRNHSCQILFLAHAGGPFNPDVLTNIVRRYMERAGFEGSCHLLRHSMATAMLENGADIRYIQMILGHASLNTTQVYTKVTIVKLKEVHARTHPGRLKKDQE
ncbi:tyrosine-type recombinase/integrase [candidate division CSSED10-310 bacterium]|uniref:Tyrosine-type recombinase/integrase n=1 Tax=candidate division CSSED10-310 bacterium TaxID=2855610 RepID=A0ABV6YW31_UNCC1